MADLDFDATASDYALQFYQAMRGQPPIRLALRLEDEAAQMKSDPFRFGAQGALSGRLFGHGDGPVVALMHGWGGQGNQFYRMALALAGGGYKGIVIHFWDYGGA